MTHLLPRFPSRLLPHLCIGLLFLTGLPVPVAHGQLSVVDSFNPSQAGGLCSLAYDSEAGAIWVYDCNAGDFQRYAEDGSFVASFSRPGESANDVDIDVAPEELQLAGTTIPRGTPLFVNGETGTADIYAVDPSSGAVITSLATDFGNSHVVGAAYHPIRNTFFLVQDRVPSTALENLIAEIDPATGNVLNSFQITDVFSVNFGDLDVCNTTGNLFVASSAESRFAEFTPDGAFVTYHSLPQGVSSLSGLGLNCETQQAWVGGTGGTVWLLEGAVLPVELSAFDVSVLDDRAVLTWTTASETENAGFVVEHRLTGSAHPQAAAGNTPGRTSSWSNLGFVDGAGTTTAATSYRFVASALPPGRHAFRLRQIDLDGTETLSKAVGVTVRLAVSHQLVTYPNPAAEAVSAELTVREGQRVSMIVYDVLGREVAGLYDGMIPAHEPVRQRLNLSALGLPSGTYFVRVVGERFTETARFVVAR